MPAVARLNDTIFGNDMGEHSGHIPPHAPADITGNIDGAVSGNVFINGIPAATVGSTTIEYDDCCGSSPGSVAEGSGTVFVNGKPLARVGDALAPHVGVANITGGSPNVFAN